jgi:cephalosporin hydroxylase
MHPSALRTGAAFFQTYWMPGFADILDVGSQDVNGTLRGVMPEGAHYLGVDLAPGPGVDEVLEDPHRLPFESARFDVVVSTSCLEHDPCFWLTFSEMLRVTRPGGFIYLNAPSNGPYHGYPLDHWRFYPDAGRALESWSRKVRYPAVLVESFIGRQEIDPWSDCVMVFAREPLPARLPPVRLCERLAGTLNRWVWGADTLANFSPEPEDRRRLLDLTQRVTELQRQLEARDGEISTLQARLADLSKATLNPFGIGTGTLGPRDRRSALPVGLLETVQKGTLDFTYKGIPCLKDPFDFALYTRLVQSLRPRTIIELGSNRGGSALWLADLLSSLGIDGTVYSIDLHRVETLCDDRIHFLQGDVLELARTLPPTLLLSLPRPLLVIEDTAHVYETTWAALRFFDPYLMPGEYILIEDGIVNDLAPVGYAHYGDGPNRAIFDFLSETRGRYAIDTDYCDFYGHNVTYNTNSYLRKLAH